MDVTKIQIKSGTGPSLHHHHGDEEGRRAVESATKPCVRVRLATLSCMLGLSSVLPVEGAGSLVPAVAAYLLLIGSSAAYFGTLPAASGFSIVPFSPAERYRGPRFVLFLYFSSVFLLFLRRELLSSGLWTLCRGRFDFEFCEHCFFSLHQEHFLFYTPN